MVPYILIDPALSSIYFKVSNSVNDLHHVHRSTSTNFWKDLDNVISMSGYRLSEINFFINFGPGSYTGLKQSKILAEVFSTAGALVKIFKQDEILKINKFKMKFFCTSAYKNQYYFSQIDHSGNINNTLLDLHQWKIWLVESKKCYSELVVIGDQDIPGEDVCKLSDLYSLIQFEELNLISTKYNQQEIYYYRAITDDYQVSFPT